MRIKNKINKRLNESSNWILNSPESLVILMLMGSGIATLFFGLLAYVIGMNSNWFLTVLFGLFSLMSLRQFIKIFRMVRKTNLKEALGGITANQFVWHKGGNENGNSGYSGNEVGSKRDAEKDKRIREEIGHIYR